MSAYEMKKYPGLLGKEEEGSNNTGIPTGIKKQIECRSGFSFDDVRVHYNSPKPAKLSALAYTIGNQVYMGPGQEKHLNHELGHVIQQKQGRVKATDTVGGLPINNDKGLEKEADYICKYANYPSKNIKEPDAVVQRMQITEITSKKHIRELQKMGNNELSFGRDVVSFFNTHRNAFVPWQEWGQPLVSFVTINRNRLLPDQDYFINPGIINPPVIVRFSPTELHQTLWLKLPPYATGDQFGAAAAALSSPFINIRIKYAAANVPRGMLEFLRDALKGQLLPAIKLPPQPMTYTITVGLFPKVICSPQGVPNPAGVGMPINEATSINQKYFNRGIRKNLNAAFGDPGTPEYAAKDAALAQWLSAKGIPAKLADKTVNIVWMRFSGFLGGAHPEHDSSYTALRQIINNDSSPTTLYIIAGDKKPRKEAKVQGIITQSPGRIFDLTEFWKNPDDVANWGGNSRFGQLRLYDYFKRNSASVHHIGTLSGNLEYMALLGHKVTYMDEIKSIGGSRMLAYEKHDRTPGMNQGDRIGYDRLLLEAPSTLKGQYIKTCMHMIYENPNLSTCIIRLSRDNNLLSALRLLLIIDTPFYQRVPLIHLNIIAKILTFLQNASSFKDPSPLNKYPEGMEQDHEAQQLMYTLILLAAKYKKSGKKLFYLHSQRGMTPAENNKLFKRMDGVRLNPALRRSQSLPDFPNGSQRHPK